MLVRIQSPSPQKRFDTECVSLYNIRMLREKRMTNSQFELFIMHSGMMQEGLKSEEALAYILRTGLSTAADIAWLVEHRAMSAAAASIAKEAVNG